MVKKTKEARKLKKFDVESEDKAVIYLNELMVRLYKCKKHLERISIKAKKISENNKTVLLLDPKNTKVNYEDYSDILNMYGGVSYYILNLIGDLNKDSISYRSFRKLKFIKDKLPPNSEEDNRMISTTTKNRNFNNHVPKALINSFEEKSSKKIFDQRTIDPIVIKYHEFVTIEYFDSLCMEIDTLLAVSNRVLELMKKDYSLLIGKDVEIVESSSNEPKQLGYLQMVERAFESQG